MIKRLTIFLLCTHCLLAALAADDRSMVQKHERDSLNSLVKQHSQVDTVRVKLLINHAQSCMENLDFLEGLKSAAEARAIAKGIGFTTGEGLFLQTMAVFHQIANSFEMDFGLDLNAYYELEANRILGGYTNFDIFGGVLSDRDGQIVHSEMRRALLVALDYFEGSEDHEILADIHAALRAVYEKLDDQKVDEHRQSAYRLFREQGRSYHQLVLITSQMRELWRSGQSEEARRWEIEAITVYVNEQDKWTKALNAAILGRTYANQDKAILALDYFFKAEELLVEIDDKDLLKNVLIRLASSYEWIVLDSEKALEYANRELKLRSEIDFHEGQYFTLILISQSLLGLGRITEFPPEFMEELQQGRRGSMRWFEAEYLWTAGRMLAAQGLNVAARDSYFGSMQVYRELNDFKGGSNSAAYLAESYYQDGDLANAIKYALTAQEWSTRISYLAAQAHSSDLLSKCYEQLGQPVKAFEYLKLYRQFKDENDQYTNEARISELEIQSVLKERQHEITRLEMARRVQTEENKVQQVWILAITGALLTVILAVIFLVRNNRQKHRSNRKLEIAYERLKSTQSQLIQSEKMASLGELTAGIAHEIQNPLNFVNNFSEVNRELIEELKDAAASNDQEEIQEILKNLAENEDKVKHHGQRAEGIVKGMLHHSRTSRGEKEPTDLNALADEYLRLAYHGMRAKDKNFNADFKTDFDPNLPKINVVPQDIGRVLLNLINNAFYAIDKKAKEGIEGYKPEVTVSTKLSPAGGSKGVEKILISVNDNGPGIPDEIKEKIFQPFFTTKPTGSGTGLGLSLSYDIVTQGHDGHLEVETKEGVGTRFIIKLLVS